MTQAKTLGALKQNGYRPLTIKEELRKNLISSLKKGTNPFTGIVGYEHTVIPDIQRALLSKHNILLLGLRGQAKTKIARLMVGLLDEYIPVVAGSEINDDPLKPLSRYAKDLIAEQGDDTPIEWVHRDRRYVEKLATPDVTVADLIGDVDPIKAANLRLPYGDERVLHFGLVPRSHRSIFVINELPDLQPRIQVALFNILQEGDIQIRGFKVRLPLDLQFVFTANPEDYTNRGSIITPLKDRIESQILTHYPGSIEVAKQITSQEADIDTETRNNIYVPELLLNLLERVSFAARDSELIDERSGVSARMSITALENLYSTAERRMLINGENKTTARIIDFWGVIPAITGKVELVYEGEQEGPYQVALNLLSTAIKEEFLTHFPHPNKEERKQEGDAYYAIREFFGNGHELNLPNDATDPAFSSALNEIPGLRALIKPFAEEDKQAYMELTIHGLAEFNVVNKELVGTTLSFHDFLSNMLDDLDEDED
ncbi:MAG TPA: magnesium chelatase [Saprospiraceae bacterium]|nr:magnesium chelatase [Saprospiraceae bacterium]HPG06092.1 magnesium chelatase [Saprospiraceae bacterium]HRV84075.1 magnesium chelatase [Saprospiraceae bacterium]